jgi:hypothetical protein
MRQRLVTRRLIAIFAALMLATASVGCGSGGTSSDSSGGMPRTDSQGFPVDSSGNVSTNANDYRAILCNSAAGKAAPDYQQECVDKGYGN